MGNYRTKAKKLTVLEQYVALKRYYPNASMDSDFRTYLIWEETLRPSPLSKEYLIKISYKTGEHPKVFVVEPMPLKLATESSRLPHVYNHHEQHLCLYLGAEWTSYRSIAYFVVPWTIDWLYHYELWLVDGNWKGGGTKH
ncbi:MAG: hypothetical protein ACTHW8_10845 [Sphingobacterium sp.]